MVAQVVALPIVRPPAPWQLTLDAAVGGLQSVGFGRDTDLLFVTSSQGRGVYNVKTGERIARDRTEEFPEDTIRLEANGIGPLEGQLVRMAGIYGGTLATTTSDGWQAERIALQWPMDTLLLVSPGSWVYGAAFGKKADMTKVFVDSEVRAWGFSNTGRSLVLATSSGVRGYSRQ